MNDKIYSLTSDMDALIADLHTVQNIIASNVESLPSVQQLDNIDLMNRILLLTADRLTAITQAIFSALQNNS